MAEFEALTKTPLHYSCDNFSRLLFIECNIMNLGEDMSAGFLSCLLVWLFTGLNAFAFEANSYVPCLCVQYGIHEINVTTYLLLLLLLLCYYYLVHQGLNRLPTSVCTAQKCVCPRGLPTVSVQQVAA